MRVHIAAVATLLPLTLTGAGGVLAAETGAAPDAAAAKCSEATLRGTYLFSVEGTTVAGKGKGPFAVGGSEVFDGHGNSRLVLTSSTNGKISRFTRLTGKTTINADCTGTSTYSDGTTIDDFIAPDGSAFVIVQTNPGTVVAGSEQRVTARKVGD
jgi:hypothetical protein